MPGRSETWSTWISSWRGEIGVLSHGEFTHAQTRCSIAAIETLEQVTIAGVKEHVYPAGQPSHSQRSRPVAVLYGRLGSAGFAELHAFLSKAAEEGRVVYVLRPFFEGNARPLTVQGYGVELAIKSMEYKAIDDSKVAAEGGQNDFADLASQQEQEVEGFVFSRMVKRRPHLAAELESFKDHLMLNMQENEGFDQLKAWQVKGTLKEKTNSF